MSERNIYMCINRLEETIFLVNVKLFFGSFKILKQKAIIMFYRLKFFAKTLSN